MKNTLAVFLAALMTVSTGASARVFDHPNSTVMYPITIPGSTKGHEGSVPTGSAIVCSQEERNVDGKTYTAPASLDDFMEWMQGTHDGFYVLNREDLVIFADAPAVKEIAGEVPAEVGYLAFRNPYTVDSGAGVHQKMIVYIYGVDSCAYNVILWDVETVKAGLDFLTAEKAKKAATPSATTGR